MNREMKKAFQGIWWSAALWALVAPRHDAFAQIIGSTGAGVTYENPLKGDINTLYDFILTFLNDIVLPIGAVVVVIFIILAGYNFIIARGNPAGIAKARKNLLWVLIGTAVLLGAWVIANVIKTTIDNLRA